MSGDTYRVIKWTRGGEKEVIKTGLSFFDAREYEGIEIIKGVIWNYDFELEIN